MKFGGMLRSDFKRMFQGKSLWAAIVITAFLILINIMPETGADLGSGSLYYLARVRRGIGALLVAMTALVVFPYGMSYREDLKNNYIHGLQIRGGLNGYVWSHVLVTALSAFLVVFLGYLLCFGILSVRLPLFRSYELEDIANRAASGTLSGFEPFLTTDAPVLYLLSSFGIEAMGYAFMAVFALMVSEKVENAFIVMAAPVMLYYGSIFLANIVPIPGFSAWFLIMETGGIFRDFANPWQILLCVFGYFVCLILIEGLVFRLWMEGRRHHG